MVAVRNVEGPWRKARMEAIAKAPEKEENENCLLAKAKR
jgi:hypothetical protein